MSASLKTILNKQYKAAFARWPKDHLRPGLQLPAILESQLADRVAGRTTVQAPATPAQIAAAAASPETSGAAIDATSIVHNTKTLSERDQLRQVNALFSLLDNRYQTKFRVQNEMMQPKSNPTYYTDLMTELQEAPQRSFFGRVAKRLGGMFRLK